MLDLNAIYNLDCMEGMAAFPDSYFDLAIVDPPYGIGQNAHRIHSRTKLAHTTEWGAANPDWDQSPPPQEYFQELFRVSRNQIIWGANHFISRMPYDSSSWIVWDKVNGSSNFADCELAWTSFPTSVRIFHYMWNGMNQGISEREGRIMQGNKRLNEVRIHPTQKPVALYRWLLKNYAKPGDRILDTHVGSASSLIAAVEMGYDFAGFEIDRHYFEQATERLAAYRAQQRLC